MPAITQAPYETIALLFIAASFRAKKWMVPTYRLAIDHLYKNGHDDPQVDRFNSALKAQISELTSKTDGG